MPHREVRESGRRAQIDVAARTIRNDEYWKGFFPKRHILNAMSSAIFTGFKKTFTKKDGKYVGITNDTDGRITAHNSLEEVTIDRQTGTLEPGKYILLRYLDPPWAGFYDIFKMINDDLLIGRVYLGAYPNGLRVFTFPMTRVHGFQQITVARPRALYDGRRPSPPRKRSNGVWRMDMVCNTNHPAAVAFLEFDLKPDGRLESRYRLLGLFEGLVIPNFTQDHFQLNDFTLFHDEIRKVDDKLHGRQIHHGSSRRTLTALPMASLGILHGTPGERNFGFYYMLTRAEGAQLPDQPAARSRSSTCNCPTASASPSTRR